MGIAWGVGYELFFYLFLKTHNRKLGRLIFWGTFIFSWIGSKLLFLLTQQDDLDNLVTNLSFWTGGGFVFYGGVIGASIFLWVLRNLRTDFEFKDLYPILPALTLGHAIGRIGCFLAGCCFGKETHSFIGIALHSAQRIPTQIIESGFLFLLTIYLLKSKKEKINLISYYFLLYGGFRFVLEFYRGDNVRGFWIFLTPSQWVSLFMVGFGFVILHKFRKLNSSFGSN